jgi:hypothetical protein
MGALYTQLTYLSLGKFWQIENTAREKRAAFEPSLTCAYFTPRSLSTSRTMVDASGCCVPSTRLIHDLSAHEVRADAALINCLKVARRHDPQFIVLVEQVIMRKIGRCALRDGQNRGAKRLVT